MIAPTSRAIIFAAAGAPISLLLASVAPSSWPLGPAWALAVVALIVADAALGGFAGTLEIETKLPPAAGVGAGPVTASFYLTFHSAAPASAEMSLDTNELLSVFPKRRQLTVANSYAQTAFSLEPIRRGGAWIDRAFVRWQGPMGLAWCQRVEQIGKSMALTPDLAAVERNAERLFSRTHMHGMKPLRDRGDGSEFDALAKFETGMDRRLVDWKQSARHLNLLAKEVRIERNHQIAFAIDTGRSMCEPLRGAPRIDRAINAALMLSYVGLKLGDRVSFFGFDAQPNLSTGFVAGARAFAQLQALTARLDYSTNETNYTLAMATLAEKLKRRSMIIVFTDFADSISAELMVENISKLARKHIILFVAFRDEELEELRLAKPAIPDDISRAVIADRLLRERSLVLARLRRIGVHIVEAPVEHIATELVRAYDELRRKERL